MDRKKKLFLDLASAKEKISSLNGECEATTPIAETLNELFLTLDCIQNFELVTVKELKKQKQTNQQIFNEINTIKQEVTDLNSRFQTLKTGTNSKLNFIHSVDVKTSDKINELRNEIRAQESRLISEITILRVELKRKIKSQEYRITNLSRKVEVSNNNLDSPRKGLKLNRRSSYLK